PGAEILDLSLRLFHRRGVEAGVEHVVDGVPIDSLFVLLADFENTAPQLCLQKRRDGLLCKLLACGLDLPLIWLTESLLRRSDLHVGIAGVQQVMREVGERLSAG